MDRRAFLKLLVAAAGVLALGPVLEIFPARAAPMAPVAPALAFDPLCEYGLAMPLPTFLPGRLVSKTYGPNGGVRPKMSWHREQVGVVEARVRTGHLREWSIERFKEKARTVLPPGTPFEVRQAVPTNFGRTKEMAWHYSPDMAGLTRTTHINGHNPISLKSTWGPPQVRPQWQTGRVDRFDPVIGCILVERAVA